jgi:long-chain acyl-CoA synthetase
MRGASRVKRRVIGWFMPVGYRRVDLAYQRRKLGVAWRLLDFCGDRLVFHPIRDSLGLPRARVCYTSGSMLSDETIRFFHALRVPLKNVYGSAEAGAVTGAADRLQTPGTVGSVNPGVETKVTERGELVVRHQGTFLGYRGLAELTAQVLDDGWVRTGDKCSVNGEGALVFTDRLDDLITLPCGDLFAPQHVESRLKCSPYIKDAWVVAHDDCETVSAVVVVDAATTGRWADRRKVKYTTFNDLSQNPEVYGLVEGELARVNGDLAQTQRIQRFVLLHREFDPDESELTRDRKLRRAFLYTRYAGLVQALRDGAPTALVGHHAAPLDAHNEKIETTLTIAAVGREGQ